MLVVLAALALSATPAMADPGQLDESFNGTGERKVSYSTDTESAVDLVLDTTGRPILVGTTEDVITLTRFRLDGRLDTGFSGDGKLTVDLGGQDLANAAARQGSKVLAVGISDTKGAVIRVDSAGRLDTTFSGDGRLKVAVPGAESVALLGVADAGDGKTIAVGLVHTKNLDMNGLIVRLTANGRLDPTFSGDGIRIIDGLKPTSVRDVIVKGDGSLILLVNDPSARIIRLKPGGALDTTFGTSGSVRPDVSQVGAAIAKSGTKTVLVSPIDGDTIAISRFTAAGAPDTTLQNGLSTVLIKDTDLLGEEVKVTDVAIFPDRSMVISGSTFDNLTLFRLTSAATLDTDFNGGLGYVETGGSGDDVMVGVGIDPAGRIVAAGTLGGAALGQGDQVVVRVLAE